MMLSKPSFIKKGCYTCYWLDNVDINLYAKCDQNSYVVLELCAFSLNGRRDGQMYLHNDYSADTRVMQFADHCYDLINQRSRSNIFNFRLMIYNTNASLIF